MQHLEPQFLINLEMPENIENINILPGELVYCVADENLLKKTLKENLGFGKITQKENNLFGTPVFDLDQDKKEETRSKIALLFPEMLFLNELTIQDSLELFFQATHKKVSQTKINALLNEMSLQADMKLDALSNLQKIDYLICRSILNECELFVVDSSLMRVSEYDQDRIMSELILHCREHGSALLVTQSSVRVQHSFPGRTIIDSTKMAVSA